MKTEIIRSALRPIGIDLFAGAGGMSLGFEQAGFDIVAAVEYDPIHCAAHHFNFPKTASICQSVASISGKEIRKKAGLDPSAEIDVVFGGAPCQGFSLIGKRALDDPRNQLVSHFVRLIKELKPKYFCFENVKGLTIGKHKTFLFEIIDALADSGYDVLKNYRVLNAVDYGVPQDRHRLFLLGARRGLGLPKYPLPTKRTTVEEAIGDLPNAENFPELLEKDYVKVSFKTKSTYGKKLRGLIEDPNDFSYERIYDKSIMTSSMRTEHSSLSKGRFSKTSFGCTEPISRYRKLDPQGVCNTLRAGTGSERGAFTSPRPIHPNYCRVITVREAARLHSYPDWFRFHATKWHGFRQVGNSVPPLLGRAVASSIIEALKVKPSKPSLPVKLGDVKLLQFTMSEAADHFEVAQDVVGKRIRKEDMEEICA
jgi:DNA (cytosine-5)-methyltransferase 1